MLFSWLCPNNGARRTPSDQIVFGVNNMLRLSPWVVVKSPRAGDFAVALVKVFKPRLEAPGNGLHRNMVPTLDNPAQPPEKWRQQLCATTKTLA